MFSLETQNEIRALAWKGEVNEATAQDIARLNVLVAGSLEARRYFVAYTRLLADLRFDQRRDAWLARSADDAVAERIPPWTALWQRINTIWGVSLTIAALVVISLVLSLALVEVRFGQVADAPAADVLPDWVARVTATKDCRWLVRQADGRNQIQAEVPGEPSEGGFDLTAGQLLNLRSGLAEITFDSGARTILTGPTECVVRDDNRLELLAGQLAAKVPPRAVGFQVDAPYLRAIDLGTEFAVEVDPLAWTELHVFDGQVRAEAINPTGSAYWQRTLHAQEAIRLEHASGSPAEPRLATAEPRRFARNMVPDLELRPYAFYTFDGDAQDASGNGHHASEVSNITFEPGREGQAARFAGRVDSYIDLPIDASVAAMPKLTWGCWVRVDSLRPEGNEIIANDNGGFDRMLTIDRRGAGEPRDRFAMFVGNKQVAPCLSPEPRLGEWTFVACVYDDTRRTATLYVEDGDRLVATKREEVQFGPSANFTRLGMHPGGIEEQPLHGAIDNLFIFNQVLSVGQVNAIRQGGLKAYVTNDVSTLGEKQ